MREDVHRLQWLEPRLPRQYRLVPGESYTWLRWRTKTQHYFATKLSPGVRGNTLIRLISFETPIARCRYWSSEVSSPEIRALEQVYSHPS